MGPCSANKGVFIPQPPGRVLSGHSRRVIFVRIFATRCDHYSYLTTPDLIVRERLVVIPAQAESNVVRRLFSCARGIIRPMRFRKLRIAFSATCLIACVLLIALWVRSYWRLDRIDRVYKNGTSLFIASNYGAVLVRTGNRNSFSLNAPIRWKLRSELPNPGFPRVNWTNLLSDYVIIPCWFPVLMSAVFAALGGLPWLGCRFSLRTLLISMTLVAVVLGLIVWTARK